MCQHLQYKSNQCIWYILNSEWVLDNAFTGCNIFFAVFSMFCCILLYMCDPLHPSCEQLNPHEAKTYKTSAKRGSTEKNTICQPANAAPSTRLLVKVYNKCISLKNLTFFILKFFCCIRNTVS